MGFYWGECNPSFKYHTARADGAPGSGGAATEGERRGGVTGAQSGRGLMLPTKRLPLSRRRPEDHLADPGSGAGGDGAGAWMEKEKEDAGSWFPSGGHLAGTLASSSLGAGRAAGLQAQEGGGGVRAGARDGRDPPRGTRLAHQHPLSPPSHRP